MSDRASSEALAVARTTQGVVCWIHVSPRSRREGVGGLHGDALRVAVKAPPVAGRANAACAEQLAGALGVARRAVRIDAASRHRRKRVEIDGPPGRLEADLRALASRDGLR